LKFAAVQMQNFCHLKQVNNTHTLQPFHDPGSTTHTHTLQPFHDPRSTTHNRFTTLGQQHTHTTTVSRPWVSWHKNSQKHHTKNIEDEGGNIPP